MTALRGRDEGRTAQQLEPGARRSVELHIEELVLHGFSPRDRYRIAAAVEAELARLFTERGVSPSLARGGEIASLDGGSFEAAPGSGAETIGRHVAQALYGGMNR
jgi:hypothetical protein